MKCDFLFIYEIRNRELETICLIKQELEKRGYSVSIVETWRRQLYYYPIIDAKVVIIFSCYGNTMVEVASSFVHKLGKLVNMQWEQVLTVYDETNLGSFHAITGSAKQALHLAWGIKNVKRLTELYNIPSDHVFLSAPPSFDFFRKELYGYYYDKSSICSLYDIALSKKIFLFISSFSYNDIPSLLLEDKTNARFEDNMKELQKISILSRREIINWLMKELPKHSDCIFIYRPHPAETDNPELLDLQKRISNFRIVKELSVKQWISVADKIYTWYSTSIAEVYAAGKSCLILRPYPIAPSMDCSIYIGCKSISTYDEFSKTFNETDMPFPIDIKLVNLYYSIDFKEPSYKRISDKLIEVLNSPLYNIDMQYIGTNYPLIGFKYLKEQFRLFLYRFMSVCYPNKFIKSIVSLFPEKFIKASAYAVYARKIMKNNYASPQEIDFIQRRIETVIAQNTAQMDL